MPEGVVRRRKWRGPPQRRHTPTPSPDYRAMRRSQRFERAKQTTPFRSIRETWRDCIFVEWCYIIDYWRFLKNSIIYLTWLYCPKYSLRFELYDIDKSGALSLDEFVHVVNDMRGDRSLGQRITKRQVASFMDWIDTTADREIDLKEFIGFFTEANKVNKMKVAMDKEGHKQSTQRSMMVHELNSGSVFLSVFRVLWV